MRRRILYSMVAMVVAVGLLLGIPLAVIAWWWVADNARQDLDSRIKAIADQLIRQEGEAGSIRPGQLDVDAFGVLLPDGGRLTIHYPVTGAAHATDRPDRVETRVIGANIDGHTVSDSIALGAAGSLLLEIPASDVHNDQLFAIGIVAMVMAASVAAGTGVAAVTAGRLADPLIDLADRAAAMGRGEFGAHWRRYGISELDRVSSALGDANAEIALRLERERETVGDVSHQLRSRLTAIQLRLDELTLHEDPAVVIEAEAGLEQVDRLARELDEFVAQSREEAAPSQPVDVGHTVATLVSDFAPAFASRGRTLVTRGGTETIAASSRPGRLREALSVLVDNALMHGAGQCRIEIGELSSGLVRITVRDDGPGVADDLAVMIFRRGFSVGRGNGVGLSLARALIEADGGRLELGSRRPPVFSIVVPAWPADDMTGDDTTGGGSSAGRSRGLGSAGLADPTRSPEITRGRVPHR
ncbi:ATP-binding protein [Gordonia amarae]|uniref:histidine kinase n=2 Tax=Gordonia amarae TaxID=36821 RepID=G7GR97_9ACTN|nr:HAMP domain-containing sensor histidine kinase [Gordonia amarae]MCS3878358.1 signal transduction histidine kinase [Gordonia amarae]QHN16998.1 ATP-binding protein [Gordonia amarae]QHN21524.1 ATP-binding protein [Gordonia amarae]QHN30374.1 ATP-binding protein [Gordonia amarae]QHN39151.1 ATP-binding protein [Gordonia amarae]